MFICAPHLDASEIEQVKAKDEQHEAGQAWVSDANIKRYRNRRSDEIYCSLVAVL